MPTKKADDDDIDGDEPTLRRFRVVKGRTIWYPKPYKKGNPVTEAPEGTSISTRQIPLARCLEFVTEKALEEING